MSYKMDLDFLDCFGMKKKSFLNQMKYGLSAALSCHICYLLNPVYFFHSVLGHTNLSNSNIKYPLLKLRR